MRSEYAKLASVQLDFRWPVAILFLLLGGLLAAYDLGAARHIAEVDPGIRVNLVWGGVMSLFGFLLLFGAWRGRRRD